MPHACVCVHVSIYLRMLRCKQNEKRSEDKSALIAKLCAKKKREIWKSSKVKGKCDAIHYDKHFTHSPNKLKTKTTANGNEKKKKNKQKQQKIPLTDDYIIIAKSDHKIWKPNNTSSTFIFTLTPFDWLTWLGHELDRLLCELWMKWLFFETSEHGGKKVEININNKKT